MNTRRQPNKLRSAAWKLALLAAAVAVLLLAGCRAEEGIEGAGSEVPPGGDNWESISTLLSGCSCHQSGPGGGNGFVSFLTYASVYDVASPNFPGNWVVATVANGASSKSTLYRVSNGDLTTPTTDMTLSPSAVTRIQNWIEAGAPEN